MKMIAGTTCMLIKRTVTLLLHLSMILAVTVSANANSNDNRTGSAGWGIQCDGVDDWGTLPIGEMPGSWTFEAWVYFPEQLDEMPIQTGTLFQIVADESDQELMRVPVGSTGAAVYAMNLPVTLDVADGAAEPGQQYHVAVVVDNNDAMNISAYGYWNGELIRQFSQAKSVQQPQNISQDIISISATIHFCFLQTVGTFSNKRERFGNTMIDDVRFWSQARTQQEIQGTMYSLDDNSNSSTALMHWWKMDEGTGVVLKDSIQSSHGSLAQRREFTNQRPIWVPSKALIDHANFTAVKGVVKQTIPLAHWDGSPTEPSTYKSNEPIITKVPYTVIDTGEKGIFDIVVEENRPPIAGNNKCLQLNGFDAYALSTDFQLPPSFTIDVWVHPFSLPPAGWTDFGSKHSETGSNIFLWEVNLVRDEQGELTPTIYVRLSGDNFYGGELLYEPQHLALTAQADLTTNTTQATLYRNGEVIYEADMKDILTNEDQKGLPWTMGQDFDNRGVVVPSDFWHGTLDEYRYWSRALTAGEVQHSMNTAIDHGPDYPHLFKTFSFDDEQDDDEYNLFGRAKLGHCESGFQARPFQVYVEEGHHVTFALPAFDPEETGAALTYELVELPSKGTALLNQTDGTVTYIALEEGDSIQTLKYRVTNRYGQEAKHLGLVSVNVLRHAPTVSSLKAVPGEGYESGSEIQIIFSEPTNKAELTGEDVVFSPPVAKNLLLSWESDVVLKALIAEPLDLEHNSADSLLGNATVTITGKVKASDDLSVETNTTSPTLEGSWGSKDDGLSAGAIAAAVILPVAFVSLLVLLYVKFFVQRATGHAPKPQAKPVPICILFTDIESSTKLWSQNPDWMSRALDVHHSEIRKSIRANRAYEVKTIGDAFMVACKDPWDAMTLGMDIQERLHKHFAPDRKRSVRMVTKEEPPQLKVRIGIHYDKCDITFDPIAKGYDYYGTAVNTASRVEDAGHGGQIVITDSLYDAVREKLTNATVRDLGMNPLRGVGDVHLYEVLPPCKKHLKFPPLRLDKKEPAPDGGNAEDLKQFAANNVEAPELSTNSSQDGGMAWLREKARNAGVVRAGITAEEDMLKFAHPIAVAVDIMFSIGGDKVKHALDVLAERWKLPTTAVSYDLKVRELAFKLSVIARQRMAEQVEALTQKPTDSPTAKRNTPAKTRRHSSIEITSTEIDKSLSMKKPTTESKLSDMGSNGISPTPAVGPRLSKADLSKSMPPSAAPSSLEMDLIPKEPAALETIEDS